MLRKLIFSVALLTIISPGINSQEALKYQLPPAEIVKIVDAPVSLLVSVGPDKKIMLVIERSPLIAIRELSAEELRLAGLRINPATRGSSRQTFNKSFTLMGIDGSNVRAISGLPTNPSPGYPDWSPNGQKFFFTNTTENGIELWICDILSLKAAKIEDHVNMVFRNSISWLSNNRSLVYSITDPERGRKPEKNLFLKVPWSRKTLAGKVRPQHTRIF
jgi:hypothetical protein